MNKTEEIFDTVCTVIEKSVGIPKDSINLNDTLFDKLGIDSIDLVDILFELETHYGVELKVSDLEKKVKESLGDKPYEIDGVITPEGLEILREQMTEVDPEKIKSGLTVHELIHLFSIQSLCKIIQYRLETANK